MQAANHIDLLRASPSRDKPTELEWKRKQAKWLLPGNAHDFDEKWDVLGDKTHCGKLVVLFELLKGWYANQDKVLIFSWSVRLLDIVQKCLERNGGYEHIRLDGTTPTGVRFAAHHILRCVRDYKFMTQWLWLRCIQCAVLLFSKLNSIFFIL